MKKYICLFLLFGLLTSCESDRLNVENINTKSIKSENQGAMLPDPANVEKGVIRIKLASSVGDRLTIASHNGIVQSGITPLDAMLSSIRATSMERLFPYAGKYEGRTRREGLHLWYVVRFDESVSVTGAMEAAMKIDGVQNVEMTYKIEQKSISNFPTAMLFSEDYPVNDKLLNKQWDLFNSGTLPRAKKDADINLFEAWKIEVGKPNVIVAIVDGGVDYTHEDLAASMHINELEKDGKPGVDDDNNGYVDDVYGYNFVSDNAQITFEEHGTHVAGTVAARNNNGVGLCGVAGGDGTPDSGVRLISCQIFMQKKNGGSSRAIKYAADNGAVISQNSWGYPYPGPYALPASDKAAIDYFIKYAGCDDQGNQLPDSPMKGGIVIFAAGNDNKEFDAYPASYEPVVAVSAMAPDWTKAWYSNYGDWVDIMAPGGDQYFPKGEILSTLPGNDYGYMQGTSMACPHVSGIAALIVSKYQGQGFTNEQLKQRLLSGLRPMSNIDKKNPKYKGKLGIGYIDAYAVLVDEKDNVAPETPQFSQVIPDFTTLKVEWKAAKDQNDGSPIAYMLYYSDQKLTGDNYKSAHKVKVSGYGYKEGASVSYLVKGLPLNSPLYFAIEAVDRWGAISGVTFTEGRTKENHAPILSRENDDPIKIKKGEKLALMINVKDPDEGQTWTYEVSGYTKGVISNKSEGGLELKFRVLEPLGSYSLKITVTDNFGATAEIDVPFTYYVNQPPKVTKYIDHIFAPIGRDYTLKLDDHFTDPDATKMTYSAKVLNGGFKADIKDGILSIRPTRSGIGTIEIVATDIEGAKVKMNFEVQAVNDDIVYLIYPVPVKKTLHVRLGNDVKSAKLQVRSASGSLIMSREVSVSGDSRLVDLNLSDIPGGSYVLYAEANGKTFKRSFVKF